MKIDLSTDIDNLAFLNYMQEQEDNTESNEDADKTWNRDDAPQSENQTDDEKIL